MLKKLKLCVSVAAFAFFAIGEAQAYTLSTGAVVDDAFLAPRQGMNGAAAEKWCANMGKRLPTLQELKEMYEKRDVIGGFTNGFDAGGWPYWAERVSNNKDGKNYGNRMIFGNGAEDYVNVGAGKAVRKFGEQGEIQHRPFWLNSGVGAYVRCVSKKPAAKVDANLAEIDSLLQNLKAGKSAFAEKWCAGEHQTLPTQADLQDAYKNGEIQSLILKCDDARSVIADRWCSGAEMSLPTAEELQKMYEKHEILGVFLKCE